MHFVFLPRRLHNLFLISVKLDDIVPSRTSNLFQTILLHRRPLLVSLFDIGIMIEVITISVSKNHTWPRNSPVKLKQQYVVYLRSPQMGKRLRRLI